MAAAAAHQSRRAARHSSTRCRAHRRHGPRGLGRVAVQGAPSRSGRWPTVGISATLARIRSSSRGHPGHGLHALVLQRLLQRPRAAAAARPRVRPCRCSTLCRRHESSPRCAWRRCQANASQGEAHREPQQTDRCLQQHPACLWPGHRGENAHHQPGRREEERVNVRQFDQRERRPRRRQKPAACSLHGRERQTARATRISAAAQRRRSAGRSTAAGRARRRAATDRHVKDPRTGRPARLAPARPGSSCSRRRAATIVCRLIAQIEGRLPAST